jgi:hypothetical protein
LIGEVGQEPGLGSIRWGGSFPMEGLKEILNVGVTVMAGLYDVNVIEVVGRTNVLKGFFVFGV